MAIIHHLFPCENPSNDEVTLFYDCTYFGQFFAICPIHEIHSKNFWRLDIFWAIGGYMSKSKIEIFQAINWAKKNTFSITMSKKL